MLWHIYVKIPGYTGQNIITEVIWMYFDQATVNKVNLKLFCFVYGKIWLAACAVRLQ